MEYGRFPVLSRVELERFFHLDDEDRKLIADRRRDSNRLGFALQVVTVRYLGMFLPDPVDVPVELVEYLAEQLGIDDPTCVKAYTDRKQTRYDHQDEIVAVYGLVPFGEVEGELLAWVTDQAWMTGDGPKVLAAGAARWLRERNALLPGITTLERLVTEGKQAADARLWTHLAGQLRGGEAATLLGLLDTQVPHPRQRAGHALRRRGEHALAATPDGPESFTHVAACRAASSSLPWLWKHCSSIRKTAEQTQWQPHETRQAQLLGEAGVGWARDSDCQASGFEYDDGLFEVLPAERVQYEVVPRTASARSLPGCSR